MKSSESGYVRRALAEGSTHSENATKTVLDFLEATLAGAPIQAGTTRQADLTDVDWIARYRSEQAPDDIRIVHPSSDGQRRVRPRGNFGSSSAATTPT
jgi:hypothetical protein